MDFLSYNHNRQWYNNIMNTIKPEIILQIVYWITSAVMIILKVIGMSTLTWFWTLIPVTWPFIVSFSIFGLVIGGGISVLILAVIVFGCIELYETIERSFKK